MYTNPFSVSLSLCLHRLHQRDYPWPDRVTRYTHSCLSCFRRCGRRWERRLRRIQCCRQCLDGCLRCCHPCVSYRDARRERRRAQRAPAVFAGSDLIRPPPRFHSSRSYDENGVESLSSSELQTQYEEVARRAQRLDIDLEANLADVRASQQDNGRWGRRGSSPRGDGVDEGTMRERLENMLKILEEMEKDLGIMESSSNSVGEKDKEREEREMGFYQDIELGHVFEQEDREDRDGLNSKHESTATLDGEGLLASLIEQFHATGTEREKETEGGADRAKEALLEDIGEKDIEAAEDDSNKISIGISNVNSTSSKRDSSRLSRKTASVHSLCYSSDHNSSMADIEMGDIVIGAVSDDDNDDEDDKGDMMKESTG